MARDEQADALPQLAVSRLALLIGRRPSPLRGAWECPRCGLVAWDSEATPRCRRCGFWETPS